LFELSPIALTVVAIAPDGQVVYSCDFGVLTAGLKIVTAYKLSGVKTMKGGEGLVG
jgi:hypothetical protein